MFGKATCSSHFSHTLASCFYWRPLGILGLMPALQRTVLAEEGHLYSITFRQPTLCLPQATAGDRDRDQAEVLGAGQRAGKPRLTWPKQTSRGSPREPQLVSLLFRCREHRGTACKQSAKMGGDGSFGALSVKNQKLAKKCVFRKFPSFALLSPGAFHPCGCLHPAPQSLTGTLYARIFAYVCILHLDRQVKHKETRTVRKVLKRFPKKSRNQKNEPMVS